ncbi:MAG: HigA family addiction module antidote protein [Magnetococcales bacterium]|uniref:HigA family addiction module antidote protein n=1 Tax=Candidatus Magnetobacterium casense TaxID=1455061 RepID=A0ABS6RWV2_9BACT|nr:HigA family addiction module antitoxin [Candidatus Magnetobacterium casensis]MBF0606753.1 HigA family addiction module antidote protein [Nitrospirota bacterium]MBV6341116.1 HigA family addiction module antidote protein [Candidatus Magnetobacterium casensis]
MSVSLMRYEPDYAVSPGDILQERLEAMSMNQAEFAKRCQISPQIINQIIHGRQRVTPEIAIIFEKITGVSAHIWNNLEASYRLHAPVQAKCGTPKQNRSEHQGG